MQDKPYYEIKYQEVGREEYTIGFGSYKLPYVLHWLDTCFEIIGEQNTENTDSISEKQIQTQYEHFRDRFLKIE